MVLTARHGGEQRARRSASFARTVIAASALVATAVACSSDGDDAKVRRDEPLRVLAAERGVHVGTAVDDDALLTDPRFAALAAREVNMVVAENAMKWSDLQPERGRFDFEAADRLIDFADANGMAVRGHTLVWHQAVPDWVADADWERDEAIAVLREHIETVVGRYRGRIEQWDVVNEPIARDGDGLEPSPWLRMIGPDYLDLAFEFSRAADPDALLHLNDFDGDFPSDRTDRIVDLAAGLVERGAPIDGVGLQFHVLGGPDAVARDDVTRLADDLADLDLDLVITEADVRLELDGGAANEEQLREQADAFGALLDGCLDVTNCDTFVMWGITDRWSWIPVHFEGFGAATPFDEEYAPKPAHARLQLALS